MCTRRARVKRTIYFTGELKEKFGKSIVLDSDSLRDVIRGIGANRPDFRAYIIDLMERGLDLRVYNAGKFIGNEDGPIFPLIDGDVILSVAPAGEGWFGKLLGGIALVAFGVFTGGLGFAGAAFLGQAITGIGIQIAMSGIMEALAPEVATEENPEEAYLFQGPSNKFLSGSPIPILYGELRVGGLPINLQTVASPFDGTETEIDSLGNIYAHRI